MRKEIKLQGINVSQIGRCLSLFMKQKNVSVTELSRFLGISYQAVDKWVKGRGLPDIENLYNLSRYLGVSLDSFLGEENGTKLDTHSWLNLSEESSWSERRFTQRMMEYQRKLQPRF